MFTLIAWGESIDPGNALTAINAVPDQHVFVSGDDIRVPDGLGNVIGVAAAANDASAARAQLQSPSLRSNMQVDIEPIVAAATFGAPQESILWPNSPIPVSPGEALNLAILSDPAAAAQHTGVAWLSDGPQQEVNGEFFTIRATAAATLAANTWVNGALTFSQSLPVGTYDVVGMRARSANLLAARLVFVGFPWRPGVIGVNAIGERDLFWLRHGRLGVWGSFHTNTPPTVDFLGSVDTAQVIHLDLVRRG